ncbi:MAG: ABC transporter permease [Thaumarchaeota archaeon]|nr:ABC transporter permease [Nitrososphaerota archaeon]MCL5317864.1 ABC transporter permease [Nitrososphaerota archaeon]
MKNKKLSEITLSPFVLRLATLAVFVVVWDGSVRAGYLDRLFFASPTEIAGVLPYTFTNLFIPNLGVTLLEYAAGFTLAIIVGLAVGVATGTNDSAYRVTNPFIGLGMTTPKVALVPLFMLALGLGWNSIAAFGALLGVFPIIINSAAGVRQVKPEYLAAARSMGHSRLKTYWKVVFPFALPTFIAGFFLGSNLVMIGVLVMELIMGRAGLSPMMAELSYNFRTPELYAAAILTITLTTGINGAIWLISRRMNSWRNN